MRETESTKKKNAYCRHYLSRAGHKSYVRSRYKYLIVAVACVGGATSWSGFIVCVAKAVCIPGRAVTTGNYRFLWVGSAVNEVRKVRKHSDYFRIKHQPWFVHAAVVRGGGVVLHYCSCRSGSTIACVQQNHQHH